jgi:hypothetical protein
MTIAIERTIRVWSTPDFSQMPVEDRPIPDNARTHPQPWSIPYEDASHRVEWKYYFRREI